MNAFAALITVILLLGVATEACEIPTAFDCANIQTNCDGASSITAGLDTVYDCQPPLLLQANELNIMGAYTALTLIGKNVTISNIASAGSLNISGT